jgi:hypothetical protein
LLEANLTFIRICYSEQIEGDIKGEKNALEEAKAGIVRLHKELGRLSDEVTAAEVCVKWFTQRSHNTIIFGGIGFIQVHIY